MCKNSCLRKPSGTFAKTSLAKTNDRVCKLCFKVWNVFSLCGVTLVTMGREGEVVVTLAVSACLHQEKEKSLPECRRKWPASRQNNCTSVDPKYKQEANRGLEPELSCRGTSVIPDGHLAISLVKWRVAGWWLNEKWRDLGSLKKIIRHTLAHTLTLRPWATLIRGSLRRPPWIPDRQWEKPVKATLDVRELLMES